MRLPARVFKREVLRTCRYILAPAGLRHLARFAAPSHLSGHGTEGRPAGHRFAPTLSFMEAAQNEHP